MKEIKKMKFHTATVTLWLVIFLNIGRSDGVCLGWTGRCYSGHRSCQGVTSGFNSFSRSCSYQCWTMGYVNGRCRQVDDPIAYNCMTRSRHTWICMCTHSRPGWRHSFCPE